jgi:hypothetical protein
VTLTGLVLPIGGVKEKVLAARRAGLKRVILPRGNQKDLRDLPMEVRQEMEFVVADRVADVLTGGVAGLSVCCPARQGGVRRLRATNWRAAALRFIHESPRLSRLCQRLDLAQYPFREPVFGDLKLVMRLQVHPHLGRGSEEAPEAHGRVGRNRAAAVDDFG